MATSKLPMTTTPPTMSPTIAPLFETEAVVLMLGASMEPVLESGNRVIDKPVCVNESVEIAVNVDPTAIVVAVGVIGTRPRVKMLEDLLPQHELNPQQNVPLDVEHSKTAGPPKLSQNIGQDGAVPFDESLSVTVHNQALSGDVRAYSSYLCMSPSKTFHSATRITR
uniref:Capsular polysaccharide biosynthesis protein CapD n=1 Tax=Talaromyces marneffei PM1 TaxID=1077442 RepID=A0A093V5J5_TALMA